MADIDQILAGGAGGGTRFDFSKTPDILGSYWKGKDEFAKNDLRDAFKGGVPLGPNGQPDFSAMAKTLFQKGDMANGVGLVSAGAGQQERGLLAGIDSPAPVVGPSTSRSGLVTIPGKRDDNGVPTEQPSQQPTVMTVMAQHVPNDQLGVVSASVARQLGVDPTAPLDMKDPQVRNVLVPAIARFKQMNLGQVQPEAAPQPAAPQDDAILKKLTFLAASPDKQVASAAKVRLENYLKSKEPTSAERDFNAAQRNPKLDDYTATQAAAKATAEGVAKSDIKEQDDLIGQGKQASNRLTTLNTLSNIISSDKNLSLGFGAPTALKVKMALESLGIPVPDLSGAQAIQKLNASLASEMAKSLTSRTTQFEFKTFLGNNPGLELDKNGNERLIGIFSQLAKRDVDLGKLARANRDNWTNWDSVVENYDKKNPMRDPVTKRVLSTDTVIAPGSSAGQPIHQEGATAFNPQTKERIILKGGKWVPFA